MPEYKLLRNGLHDKALALRTKIQVIGGGFGNGKTTVSIIKALQISQDYPGANILMARSTYPKLNDTLRKEFIKWRPKEWEKSFPMSTNSSNVCTLKNGSQFAFRYIAQQGRSEESTTSNLLSATYDLIVVDQMEDPEISYKDFLDLIGRLRGQAPYRGSDPTMPRHGPRWIMLTVNPTRNWVYKQLVAPVHLYKERGIVSDELLCMRDEHQKPILKDGKPELIIDLVEGSTYENKHILPDDYISGLESTYTGQMRDRYLHGRWAAYEGLIYPQFDEQVHMVGDKYIKSYLQMLNKQGYDVEWVEGYDFGIAAPSCYMLGFVDPHGNIVIVDGFYKREFRLEDQFAKIKDIRSQWTGNADVYMQADPDIFRRGKNKDMSVTIADMFWQDAGIAVRRANNDRLHGIAKLGAYLNVRKGWINPFTLDEDAPSFYVSSSLTFFAEEIASYFWKKHSVTGQRVDEPQESNDHAMDTGRYILTTRPEASQLRPSLGRAVPAWMRWQEDPNEAQAMRTRRHG
jgi:hypothetical protein